jgi:hypothetical protein
MDNSYIATVEGVDVFGADFTAGTAWLFSPYILQAVEYNQLDTDAHIVTLRFEPGEDSKARWSGNSNSAQSGLIGRSMTSVAKARQTLSEATPSLKV